MLSTVSSSGVARFKGQDKWSCKGFDSLAGANLRIGQGRWDGDSTEYADWACADIIQINAGISEADAICVEKLLNDEYDLKLSLDKTQTPSQYAVSGTVNITACDGWTTTLGSGSLQMQLMGDSDTTFFEGMSSCTHCLTIFSDILISQ